MALLVILLTISSFAVPSGEDDSALARAIHLHEQGRFVEAEALYEQHRSSTTELYGPDSREAAQALLYMGAIYFSRLHLDEAEDAARQALRLYETLCGKDSREAAWALVTLAAVLGQEGQLARATPVMRRAIFLLEKARDQDQAVLWAQENLAILYQRQGDYALARTLLERILVLHPHLANAEAALAEVAIGQGRWSEASDLIVSAHQTVDHNPGPKHFSMAGILVIEARVKAHSRDVPGAIDCLARADIIFVAYLGANAPLRIVALEQQQALLRRAGRRSEARIVRAQIRAIHKRRG
jgi:tetratricopeptide (TPR) repeat protein